MKHLTIVKTIIFLALLGCSNISFATCGFGDSGTTLNATINFGSVIVQRDAPVGSVLNTTNAYYPGGDSSAIGCNTSYTRMAEHTLFTTSSSINNVFLTNIPGVGIRLSRNGLYFNFSSPQVADAYLSTYFPIVAELIKLSSGGVGGGALSTGTIGKIYIYQAPQYYDTVSIGNGTIYPVACSITTPNIQVPLDDVLTSSLTAVGSISKPKAFNVGLNCDVGARVNAKLIGNQNTDSGASGVLQLTGAGSNGVATGVGIQILYNGSPMALNTNMILKTSMGGQETFPFTAQYYQTKSAVTTGSANATATLELTYQ
ncbi:fimbrial protein [Serratia quinivorans]|uniref:fimbrial protein n=1 Tax=Serratia quinivorans TaxID=137545 RepID=UPI003F9D0F79